jgi:hypothetical protein
MYGNRKHEIGKHTNNAVVDRDFIICKQNGFCPVINGLQKSPLAPRIPALLRDVKSVAYFLPFNAIPKLVLRVSSLGVNDIL